jgi:8-oxo-dGTP pyrophosphatase MutT (NUDIX family)
MIDSRSVETLVRALVETDGELAKSRDLILHLLAFTPEPFSRQQFIPGHITCTGMVLAPDVEEILLVHHHRLDRWLLPGGHVELEDAAIWESARREVVEETGATLATDVQPRLIGLDVHGIPPGKGEPYHLHHDLLFLFQAQSRDFRLSHESRAVAWAGSAELERYALPRNIPRAYERQKKGQ